MRTILYLFLITPLFLVSCKKESKENTPIPTTEKTEVPAASNGKFDLSAIPVSEAVLSPIPYFELNEKYEFQRNKITEGDSLRFWTGHHFESPKGKIYQARIVAKGSHQFSGEGLSEDLIKKFTEAGAVKVFEGKVPTTEIEAYITKNGEKNSIDYLDAYGFQGYAKSWMYIIKQQKKIIWIQLNESDDNASMLFGIVESEIGK